MKRMVKTILGVTLLEIMLVLAIAAMIIVMSVRYYQSANASQLANSALSQIQAITAAANSVALATGSFSGVSSSQIASLIGAPGQPKTPWNTPIQFNGTTSSFTLTYSTTPGPICPLVISKVGADPHFTTKTCSAGGDLRLVYTP